MKPRPKDQYRALHEGFRWHVPALFNISAACAGRWARHLDRTAIFYEDDTGARSQTTYRELDRAANRLANALRALGIARGDRVAVVLPQRPEAAVADLAILRLGAIAMPLSILFGPDALAYRLENSGARAAIVDSLAIDNCRQARTAALAHFIVVQAPGAATGIRPDELDWNALLAPASERFRTVATASDEPAFLVYTSGTTGPAKGALIPHRTLIGNLPGFVASQNWFPQPGDVFWSPADWAWTGGLMDALMPSLYFVKPIVAYRGRFGADVAYDLLARYRVTNSFLFPTALKMMMRADPRPRQRHQLALRGLMSAGESVGETLFEWCQDGLGLTVNEMYGQTEVNYIVGNSALRWPATAGSIGRPYPGHRVAVIDDEGVPVRPGETGEVAIHRCDRHGHPDPIFFLGYWQNPRATADKFSGDWCRTGDLASADELGYLWYRGRGDDMFKAAGYRIGPGEIENCLMGHPAVANVAVVPKPDPERGNVVKAYVVLAPEYVADSAVAARLQEHVRSRLAPYEYPKEIEFIEALPMTTTGKVQRRVLRLQEEERARQRGG